MLRIFREKSSVEGGAKGQRKKKEEKSQICM